MLRAAVEESMFRNSASFSTPLWVHDCPLRSKSRGVQKWGRFVAAVEESMFRNSASFSTPLWVRLSAPQQIAGVCKKW
ncbi:hypothetical protein [Brevibacillus migulae]|uniref:hypothetical protein n=1 Tax=Brevibacillus migulae TaxID=1644114 RepID=UPI00106EC221|nr:hypothetical protein [Brevibacillus migulae]